MFIRVFTGEELACQCRRHSFNPWVRKIPWRRKWQPTPVFLLGESRGRRSLVGYSPWGHKRIIHDWAAKLWQQMFIRKSGAQDKQYWSERPGQPWAEMATGEHTPMGCWSVNGRAQACYVHTHHLWTLTCHYIHQAHSIPSHSPQEPKGWPQSFPRRQRLQVLPG